MSNAWDVVTLGEAMALLAPVGGAALENAATLVCAVAGSESTVAGYLARLGHRVAWVSAVGDDPFGRRVLRELAGAGVAVDRVRVDPSRPTGVFFKDPTPGGSTRVHYYRSGSAASALGEDAAARVRALTPRHIHVSGITPALSPTCDALVRDLLRDHADATFSFDVNHRPALWNGRDAGRDLRAIAAAASIVFVGRDEAEALWGTPDADAVRALLPEPTVLVVKDAEIGATGYHGDRRVFIPAPHVDVLEPVGAGDAFAAGFLHGRLAGHDLARALTDGHTLAGVALRSPVDLAPIPPDVVARLVAPETPENGVPS